MKKSIVLAVCIAFLWGGCKKQTPTHPNPNQPTKGPVNPGNLKNPHNPKNPHLTKNPPVRSGDFRPGWLGASFSYYIKNRKLQGALITKVVPGSPLDKAGLQSGDVILGLNNYPILRPEPLLIAIQTQGAGNQVRLLVRSPRRGPKSFRVSVRLGTPTQNLLKKTLEKGAHWLASQQRKDGGWRHFATATDRSAAPISALVLSALASIPHKTGAALEALEKGIQYLLKEKGDSGLLGDTQDKVVKMSVYTTALAVIAMAQWNEERFQKEIQQLVQKLKEAQLTESAKFSKYDYQYGAWNYWEDKKRTTMRADVSVASFVLEALWKSGVSSEDPVFKRAIFYLHQCQNYEKNTSNPYMDGGFHFSPLESKAGIITTNSGKDYFRSYGSSSADGLRSLFYCGVSPKADHVQQALKWIGAHFDLLQNPGFEEGGPLNFNRGILYYYYASLSKALARSEKKSLSCPQGKRFWASELAGLIIPKQDPKGFWINRENVMNEDHPELTTALALIALSESYPFLPGDD